MKALFFLIAISFSASQSLACMCVSKSTPQTAFSKSTYAVAAQVAAVSDTEVEYDTGEKKIKIPSKKFSLVVSKSYKGSAHQTLEVISRKTSCFRNMELGKNYVLYVTEYPGNPIEIGTCSRVVPAEQSQEDIQFLSSQN